ncbi:MAG: D-glycero-beta-D-manno-heptose 1-phosphate adenylyltransferase [Proteobacteria bacterium]|nr:D-glycero-beta-D-manno-heptose 1-phosphate adenylyltransferase [Pseudomonadota bacterium]
MKKIGSAGAVTLEALLKEVAAAKTAGKKIVFTNGCFDIIHRGHVSYMNRARALGDMLIVGINSDTSVRTLKGPTRPVNAEADRAYVLANLKAVDAVVIFGDETPIKLIEAITPHVLVKGGDWPVEKIVGADHVRANGGEVLSLALEDGYSTTGIIARAVS